MEQLLKPGDVIYEIPDAETHLASLLALQEHGYPIHPVMWTNDFSEYPHIHCNSSYIGGTRSPIGTHYYNWVSYREFKRRLDASSVGNTIEETDWREGLSKQFEEKLKSYGTT